MIREDYVEICEKCELREMNPKKGIICSITKEYANFDKECANYIFDKKTINKINIYRFPKGVVRKLRIGSILLSFIYLLMPLYTGLIRGRINFSLIESNFHLLIFSMLILPAIFIHKNPKTLIRLPFVILSTLTFLNLIAKPGPYLGFVYTLFIIFGYFYFMTYLKKYQKELIN